jgi:ATP-dependent RNA helicase DOB1
VDTADELLVTELMFNGCFGRLDHHQLVALSSCFMPVEKSNHFVMSSETKGYTLNPKP